MSSDRCRLIGVDGLEYRHSVWQQHLVADDNRSQVASCGRIHSCGCFHAVLSLEAIKSLKNLPCRHDNLATLSPANFRFQLTSPVGMAGGDRLSAFRGGWAATINGSGHAA